MKTASLALALAAVAAPLAHAQGTPAAYLERGQVLASDNEIRIYRLPTKDSKGAIKYWDVTIPLVINTWGKPENSASVVSVASPKFLGSDFVAGTYKDNYGNTCTLTTGLLDGGRQEGALSCPTYYSLTTSWTSGPIAGHPVEPDLLSASINTIPGYQNYAWGKVGYSGLSSAYGCFGMNDVISARQVGDQIVLSSTGNDNITDCGMTFLRQTTP